MFRKSHGKKLNAQILEEAAEWFIEFEGDDADLADRHAFDAWLRRSPEHVRAFLELLPLWEQGAAARPSPGIDAEHLIALASNARGNVVPLEARSTRPAAKPDNREPPAFLKRKRILRSRYGSVAAAAVALVATGIFSWWHFASAPGYSTGIAEHRSVVLSDGSTIELNARSRIRVRFTERERAIDLLEGQALFQVGKDVSRPFVVRSEGARVQAIGTQFDVNRKKSEVTVTVLEGRVSVLPNAPAPSGAPGERPVYPVLLSAGEQTSVGSSAVERPKPANMEAATAWTQRRLVFQKTSLAEVVDEFNRYNSRQVHIEDPRIEQFLVSGTFSSTDPASLLRFLREQSGIDVIETHNAIRIVSTP